MAVLFCLFLLHVVLATITINSVVVASDLTSASAGNFSSASSCTFGATVFLSPQGNDAVIWRVNHLGTSSWAISGGGSMDDELYGITVNTLGDIVGVGGMQSQVATY